MTGQPAVSLPLHWTNGGLPVGIQIVGRYRDDFGVLQLAHAFEGDAIALVVVGVLASAITA